MWNSLREIRSQSSSRMARRSYFENTWLLDMWVRITFSAKCPRNPQAPEGDRGPRNSGMGGGRSSGSSWPKIRFSVLLSAMNLAGHIVSVTRTIVVRWPKRTKNQKNFQERTNERENERGSVYRSMQAGQCLETYYYVYSGIRHID